MCIPLLMHGDEGRGQKKRQLMVCATHGMLGKGSSHSNAARKDLDSPDGPLRLNMVGSSWLNHFLHCVLPIGLYSETPEAFYQVLDILANDYKSLFENGLEVNGRRYWACCVGIKGDAPFLAKSGRFLRSFSRKPTRSSSKTAGSGVCHLCLAGKEDHSFAVPFEQLGVLKTAWLWTVGEVCPMDPNLPSPLVQIPFQTGGTSETLWQFDMFHNFHSGLGKSFSSSAIIVCLELAQASIDTAFEIITADFKQFCANTHEHPYHKKLTKSLFGVEKSFRDCPDGSWSKGDFTRLIMKWFGDWAKRNVLGKTDDPLYLKCVSFSLV